MLKMFKQKYPSLNFMMSHPIQSIMLAIVAFSLMWYFDGAIWLVIVAGLLVGYSELKTGK